MKIDKILFFLFWCSFELENALFWSSRLTYAINKVVMEVLEKFTQKQHGIVKHQKYMDYIAHENW